MSIEKHIEFVKNVSNQMQIFTTGLKGTQCLQCNEQQKY